MWLFLLVFDFCFLSTSPEISWEEQLRNDIFCVEWDVKDVKVSQTSLTTILGEAELTGRLSRVFVTETTDDVCCTDGNEVYLCHWL